MTPPPEALAAPASRPADAPDPHGFDRIGLTPAAIFDGEAAFEAIRTESHGGSAKEVRAAAVSVLRDRISTGREAIAAALAAHPLQSRPATRAYCYLTDGVVQTVFRAAEAWLHPNPNPTEGERLALLAVGGYGRGEMAPFSDVDLLFVMPWKVTPWAESLIESMLYIFWDLHLKVGHATRSIKDCVRLGREDFTIRTALLEHRYIIGDTSLAAEFDRKLRSDLFRNTASEFVEAKLVERAARHQKQGGQRYMVEPNVKEGKGGLRDLQTLFWIGKYIHGVQDAAELVRPGLFTHEEYQRFLAAETFLMAVRCHLHLIAGRAVDQLAFDMQVEVADRMGYEDKGGRRAVEHFMQDYFRHATEVGELTRIFLTALEAQHVRTAPSFTSLFRRKRALKPGYALKHNRLAIADDRAFLADKLNLLRLFEEALRTGYLIHPDAMRLVRANLHLIDDEMRAWPEANAIFMDLLLKHGNPERSLRRMNELGVLGAFIPEFAPVVAMMQFNMYHHYTVDEHTIQCISTLAQIERGELLEELPIASRILKEGVNRKVLYVALFLHDTGKGRDEDHSVLGAQIARKVAPRLGLKKEEAEQVEWLVRYHLLMSDMAQKRDLSEPRTVRDFAKAVKTKKGLDLLTVLTVCDIRGVGPGVWNNWKAQLLRDLYRQTSTALEHGLEAVNRESAEAEAKKALRAALSTWEAKALRHETSRHYGPYWQGLPGETHVVFARLLDGIEDHQIRIDVNQDEDRDATRVCFALADHPGIFSRLAGALALVGANVVDARTYTSSDGYATAVFWIQDTDGHPYESVRLPRLRGMIQKTLHGEVLPRKSLADKDRIKKRERAFRVPTSITFDNDGSEIYTIIEVDTRDRPGLLYDLTRTMAEANVYIASAVIATYGEQVVDTFYVKDMFGLKYHTQSKQKSLEKRLREAIEAGAARARAE
ncbi:[protein-PII] uridylyltransferase [Silicimonas algicola]|uniref:Bifunctional uridylyltransferase/uridylyl-removing enzyme n=1 Tax=Silicimonas algicola TaxID=1826607 RepID=A0A316GC14_9RHOB|nr:[protein-PII] uridylyltransferase [Silicimonas algicola]AZQ66207.1 [protein-PII] uridylyltransferase [Silicimonas algicola]PWK58519.1 UTP--GlnB (protein PII) uridylyltransferase GlnD [Silicimonas algicola]